MKDHKKLHKDEPILIRQFSGLFDSANDTRKGLREMKIYRQLTNHENILRLYDIIPPKKPRGFFTIPMILEYFPTTLSATFRTYQFWSTQHIKCILYQILCGIKYMHSLNIAHRKLNPKVIRIDENCK